jgi:hypothetical protein
MMIAGCPRFTLRDSQDRVEPPRGLPSSHESGVTPFDTESKHAPKGYKPNSFSVQSRPKLVIRNAYGESSGLPT